MLSSCISFNICLKNISGRLAKKRVSTRPGRVFPLGNGFGSGTGSGSGRKNVVPPDPNLEVVLVIVKLSEFYHLLSTWIIFQLVVKTYQIDVSCFFLVGDFEVIWKKLEKCFSYVVTSLTIEVLFRINLNEVSDVPSLVDVDENRSR